MLAEIVQQDDNWIEQANDFIQWLFPDYNNDCYKIQKIKNTATN